MIATRVSTTAEVGTRAILSNAGALVGTSAVTSLLGLPYWWIAARAFPSAAVGFAAASISAMTLIGTLGMLGLGTYLTGELPRRSQDRASLLATALTFTAGAGLVLGLAFALVAPELLGLETSAGRPVAALLFASGVALTAATLVIDQAMIGLLRGGLQLRRNIVFAVSKLLLLAIVAVAALEAGGEAIYATWVGGLGISAGWLAVAARREGARLHHCRPRWNLFRDWRRPAMEHHFLNLALQAPTLVMPLVVAATVSVTASAYWYTASLITGFLAYGAIALTLALYAVGVRDEARLAQTLRFTLRLAFGVILGANLVLILGSRLILQVFGPEYAANAATVLRIQGIVACLMIIKDHYIAIARIRGTVLRAAILCTAGAALEIGLASAGGTWRGLTWVALGALAGLAVELCVMLPAVLRELRPTRDRSALHHVNRQLTTRP
jgi:O-antigen/teichoic acid export membrane protein